MNMSTILNFFGLSEVKIALAAIIVSLFLGLLFYCHTLRADNAELNESIGKLQGVANRQSTALTECNNSTIALVKKQEEETEKAKAAVEEAKKEAAQEYQRATDLAHRKPKNPVVTTDNAKNYGGTDTAAQVKDYYSVHELLNEEIDLRLKQKAKK